MWIRQEAFRFLERKNVGSISRRSLTSCLWQFVLFVKLAVVDFLHLFVVLGVLAREVEIVVRLALVVFSCGRVLCPPAVRMVDGASLHTGDPVQISPDIVVLTFGEADSDLGRSTRG